MGPPQLPGAACSPCARGNGRHHPEWRPAAPRHDMAWQPGALQLVTALSGALTGSQMLRAPRCAKHRGAAAWQRMQSR